MNKQIGVVCYPTEGITTIARFDRASEEWVWVETFNNEER